MDNTILAGKYLRTLLLQSDELMSLISPNKIIALQENPDTTFPFIVYSRDNITPIYTKNFLSDNNISFTIVVVSNDYDESLDIANAVRHAIEAKMYSDENITIHPIRITSVAENTLYDSYIQTIRCTFSAN